MTQPVHVTAELEFLNDAVDINQEQYVQKWLESQQTYFKDVRYF